MRRINNAKNSTFFDSRMIAFFFLTGRLTCFLGSHAFLPKVAHRPYGNEFSICRSGAFIKSRLQSSVGDGPPHDEPPSSGKRGEWDEFLNPENEESESLFKAREFVSENSLPISFDANDRLSDENADKEEANANTGNATGRNSSALVGLGGSGRFNALYQGSDSRSSTEELANNPYVEVVTKLSPSELISRFTTSTHPSVQNAVRTTILGMIGGLPKLAFDTTTISTGQRLASLMFQLQMTGYMFKNAEYRFSVQQSLGVATQDGKMLLPGTMEEDTEKNGKVDLSSGKIRGKLRLRYRGMNVSDSQTDANEEEVTVDEDVIEKSSSDDSGSDNGVELEVDAAAYFSELRAEVASLKNELITSKKAKEEALNKDLLLYIRQLPPKELQSLTNTMSPDVLIAMKALVNAVLSGIGEGAIGPDTVTELSGEAMAQLCLWQLAIGYNLRTLEVREEMRKSLAVGGDFDPDAESGVDYSRPGVLD